MNTDNYRKLEERIRQQQARRQALLSKTFKVDEPHSALESILVLLTLGVLITGIAFNVTLKTTPKICQERPGTGTLKDPIIGAFKPCQMQIIGNTKP